MADTHTHAHPPTHTHTHTLTHTHTHTHTNTLTFAHLLSLTQILFVKYYDTVMPLLLSILVNASDKVCR